jgi:hypothetical protein
MRWSILLPPLGSLLVISLFAQTPMDTEPVKELKRTGSLGTCGYAPAENEKPFFEKLAPKEKATGSFIAPYKIQGRKGKFVSWFGTVRGIVPPTQGENKLTLLLEQRPFDGLTDCHIMLVSAGSTGDFIARLEADSAAIPALALVRVYGKVVEEKDKVPRIAAEYVRVWPWGTFTFTDLGIGKGGNPRWEAYCKLCKSDRIYNPYPNENYYIGMLGDPKEFGLNLKDNP